MKLNKYTATKLTTKNPKLLSNLTNAQEAVQLYLNKKNQKGGPLGEEGDGVRIDNSFSLETQAQEQGSNPEPGFLWATRPVDRRTACLHFSVIEPPQADTKHVDPCSKKRQAKEIITPNGGLITAPNGGLITTPNGVYTSKQSRANPRKRHGSATWSHDLNTKARYQAAKSRFLTNEKTPRPSAILPPFDPSTQFPQPWSSQCPNEPPMKSAKFGGGYYIDPRTLRSKFIAIFE
ncbi:hypothetical protein DSO57_1011445 [Entomophthora muscae]|uniref:Uncharacterized protein n=1 Tax=Entomophthora muscae TaxID=34485 RepID=A0ACC2RKZ0_9FUNG|nr:hypothetical protein DSO57_1011445 [Entomophthora muscae]